MSTYHNETSLSWPGSDYYKYHSYHQENPDPARIQNTSFSNSKETFIKSSYSTTQNTLESKYKPYEEYTNESSLIQLTIEKIEYNNRCILKRTYKGNIKHNADYKFCIDTELFLGQIFQPYKSFYSYSRNYRDNSMELNYEYSNHNLTAFLQSLSTGQNLSNSTIKDIRKIKNKSKIFIHSFYNLLEGLKILHLQNYYHGNICSSQIVIDEFLKFAPFIPKKLENTLALLIQNQKISIATLYCDQSYREYNFDNIERNQKSDIFALGMVFFQILAPELSVIEIRKLINVQNYEEISKFIEYPLFSELVIGMTLQNHSQRLNIDQCLEKLQEAIKQVTYSTILDFDLYANGKNPFIKSQFHFYYPSNKTTAILFKFYNEYDKEKTTRKTNFLLYSLINLYEIKFIPFNCYNSTVNEIFIRCDIPEQLYPLKFDKLEGRYIIMRELLYLIMKLYEQNYIHTMLTIDMIYQDNQNNYYFSGAEYLREIQFISKKKIPRCEEFKEYLPPEVDECPSYTYGTFDYFKVFSYTLGVILAKIYYMDPNRSISSLDGNYIYDDLNKLGHAHLGYLIYSLLTDFEKRLNFHELISQNLPYIDQKLNIYSPNLNTESPSDIFPQISNSNNQSKFSNTEEKTHQFPQFNSNEKNSQSTQNSLNLSNNYENLDPPPQLHQYYSDPAIHTPSLPQPEGSKRTPFNQYEIYSELKEYPEIPQNNPSFFIPLSMPIPPNLSSSAFPTPPHPSLPDSSSYDTIHY